MTDAPSFPRLDPVGLDGLLVRFDDRLSEPANRAALALRAALERDPPDGVEEITTALVSALLRFDPLHVDLETLAADVRGRLRAQDWYNAPLPEGRRLLRIPTCYDAALAPQLEEAAAAAGLSPAAAVESLSTARVRVTTIGFAPGQPYLGTLPEAWDIPRQAGLTPRVPKGALVVAIRQFVLFSVSAPTGWRHIGQTLAPLFDLEAEPPFLLRPGDEVVFPSVARGPFEAMQATGAHGVTQEPLT